MDLALLRSLLVVAEHGSVTQAAARIGVTQSAMSRRLQQLEDYFDAELVVRGRRGAGLTELGRIVADEARHITDRLDQLRSRIASYQGLETGTVRIGGGATAVSFVLPQAIAAFQAAHPGVLFQVKEAGSNEVADDVVNGRLELGIVTLPVQGRDLDITPLLKDHIELIGPKHHPLTRRKRVTIADLESESIVGFEAGTAVRNIIDGAVREAGANVHVTMELRSIPAILRMVSTTGSLAFVSHLAIDSSDDIRRIPLRGLKIERRLAVVSRSGAHLSAASQSFAAQLLSG